jgi:hypothetical protein
MLWWLIEAFMGIRYHWALSSSYGSVCLESLPAVSQRLLDRVMVLLHPWQSIVEVEESESVRNIHCHAFLLESHVTPQFDPKDAEEEADDVTHGDSTFNHQERSVTRSYKSTWPQLETASHYAQTREEKQEYTTNCTDSQTQLNELIAVQDQLGCIRNMLNPDVAAPPLF